MLYLRVQYTIESGHLSPVYSYGEVSGIYDTGNISAFLNCVRTGDFSGLTRLSTIPTTPPVPVIQYPSYIVMSLDPNGDAGFSTVERIRTDNDYPSDYFNLLLAPDDPFNPSAPYHIAYFRCKSPSQRYVDTGENDAFNLYLAFETPDGGSGTGMIDPDVRNSGHGT